MKTIRGFKIKIKRDPSLKDLKKKMKMTNCKVVIYNYVLCWLYSMTKIVVFAFILFFVFCEILLYWV